MRSEPRNPPGFIRGDAVNRKVYDMQKTFACPVPQVNPFGFDVTAEMVAEVWDTFVVNDPANTGELPQSAEMRALMAILRAVYAGLGGHGIE